MSLVRNYLLSCIGFVVVILCCTIQSTASENSPQPNLLERAYCSLTELFANVECCRPARVAFKYEGFMETLDKKLYGQPIAAKWLATAVRDHWDSSRKPNKALAIVLYGPGGTGKTYITKILADFTFELGAKSQYYHLIPCSSRFPHKDNHADNVKQLHSLIRDSVSRCEKSVFVFDEIDKVPVSLLDSLKPFVDSNSLVDGLDFRRSIFIFMSNAAGSHLLVNHMTEWKRSGRHRDNFPIHKHEKEVLEFIFHSDQSGLKDSELLSSYLISHVIPFLPLEREHIVKCIHSYLSTIGKASVGDAAFIREVLDEMPFMPAVEKFFSASGCKRVIDKVDSTLHLRQWNKETAKTEL